VSSCIGPSATEPILTISFQVSFDANPFFSYDSCHLVSPLNPFSSVANGNYKVVLHFAEVYSGTAAVGKRVFNVFVEGTKVLNQFDITKEVGAYKAVARSFDVSVTDGSADITFEAVVENPKV
jgi:hypothetical protein